jgi:hypothetical protein
VLQVFQEHFKNTKGLESFVALVLSCYFLRLGLQKDVQSRYVILLLLYDEYFFFCIKKERWYNAILTEVASKCPNIKWASKDIMESQFTIKTTIRDVKVYLTCKSHVIPR